MMEKVLSDVLSGCFKWTSGHKMLQTGRETSPASDRYDMKAHHRQTTVSSNECVRDHTAQRE